MSGDTSGSGPHEAGTPSPGPGSSRSEDPTGRPVAVRASDSDRESTARLLHGALERGQLTLVEFDERTAAAYAARTRSELTPLTADLVPPGPVGAPAAPATGRVTGGSGPGTSLAVMGGVERTERWTVPERHVAIAVMGGVELDLRQATFADAATTIVAISIMGGIAVLVPEDVRVEVDGVGLLGGFGETAGAPGNARRPVGPAPEGAPVVRVVGLALMGGVEVRRVPRADTGDDPVRD